MRSVFQHNGSSEMTVARSQAVATILMKYLSIKNEYENGWRTAMNRSKVMQQWFAIPDNRITEIRYPLATDSWIMRITGNRTPPRRISDMANETRKPLVYVRRDLLLITKRNMVTLASTIKTDKTVIATVIRELSAISNEQAICGFSLKK